MMTRDADECGNYFIKRQYAFLGLAIQPKLEKTDLTDKETIQSFYPHCLSAVELWNIIIQFSTFSDLKR